MLKDFEYDFQKKFGQIWDEVLRTGNYSKEQALPIFAILGYRKRIGRKLFFEKD
ncbi:MAG: hypothetical protein ACI94Y_002853 [Maribacter sp.]